MNMLAAQDRAKAGLLVVDRKRSFPVPDEVGRYRGFDATLWPTLKPGHPYLEAGVAPLSAIDGVKGLVGERYPSRELLYVTGNAGFRCPLPARLVGYDLGILESGYNCFSILLNEVLIGPLSAWQHLLNEDGLLREPLSAQSLLHGRARAAAAGIDFEELEHAPYVFAIYTNIGD